MGSVDAGETDVLREVLSAMVVAEPVVVEEGWWGWGVVGSPRGVLLPAEEEEPGPLRADAKAAPTTALALAVSAEPEK